MSAAQNVMASEPQQVQWHYVCETNDLVTNSGVCALVDSQQVAIFSLKINGETQVFAISNYDPIGKANVLYRGLLGSIGTIPSGAMSTARSKSPSPTTTPAGSRPTTAPSSKRSTRSIESPVGAAGVRNVAHGEVPAVLALPCGRRALRIFCRSGRRNSLVRRHGVSRFPVGVHMGRRLSRDSRRASGGARPRLLLGRYRTVRRGRGDAGLGARCHA